ncbi:TSUP family transporter [Streptomyces sp. NPDC049837]|uniref:TSUP family transporter n=1 Tax=Streptomyces sp. NPDC049837 TaxID=3155277 RepID=UPI003423C26D
MTTTPVLPGRAVCSLPLTFACGAGVGALGGTIVLGGAEFRLPRLIGVFGFAALSAVILNKAMSLMVVRTALPTRLAAVSLSDLGAHRAIAVNLLAGSLLGAWAGASWAVRMRTATLYKVLAVLMVAMAGALILTHTTELGSLGVYPGSGHDGGGDFVGSYESHCFGVNGSRV